jgi:hypothetical protein
MVRVRVRVRVRVGVRVRVRECMVKNGTVREGATKWHAIGRTHGSVSSGSKT